MSIFGRVANHLEMTTRCWLPPLRYVAFCSIDGVLMASFSTKDRASRFSRECSTKSSATALEHGHRDVLADRKPGNEPFFFSILRHEPDAALNGVSGRMRRGMARPFTTISPVSMARSPKMARASSVLPARPIGNSTISPCRTESEMSRKIPRWRVGAPQGRHADMCRTACERYR